MKLYHYTCDHGAAGIGLIGTVQPRTCPWALELPPVVWLTDLARPDRDGLGLTSTLLTCDRLAYRYIVTDPTVAAPWAEVADRVLGDTPGRRIAEAYGCPEHWFVADVPVRATRDLTYTSTNSTARSGCNPERANGPTNPARR